MAQQQYAPYPGYMDPTARLISEMITKMGEDFAAAITTRDARTAKEKDYKLQSLTKLKDFMTLAPDKRAELLKDPAFRKQIMEVLDPHLFSKHNVKKEGAGPSQESVTSLGAPTALEKEQLSEQMAKTGKAQAEQEQTRQEVENEKEYADLARRYNKGDKTVTPAMVIQAATKAKIAGALEHPENVLHPELALEQKKAETPGTKEFYDAEEGKQVSTMVDKYDIKTPEDLQAVKQIARALHDPNAALPKKFPLTMEQVRADFEKQKIAQEDRKIRETEFTNDTNSYKFLTDNGMSQQDAKAAIETRRKTGAWPKGFLLPKDQKAAADLKIAEQQGNELVEKVRIAKNYDPELEDMIKAAQQYTGPENATARGMLADKIWARVKSRYPDLQEKPKQGWWDWFLEKGSAALNVGSAGSQYGIAAGSSAISGVQERKGTVPQDVFGEGTPPIVPDVANAAIGVGREAADIAEPGAKAVVGATMEGMGNFANAMEKVIAYTVPGFSKRTRADLQKGVDWPSFSSPFAFAHSMRNETPIGGVKPSLKDMQIQRDAHLDNFLRLAKDPNTTAEDKLRLRSYVEAIQAAGDDEQKLTILLSVLSGGK